jgi:Response receiver domain
MVPVLLLGRSNKMANTFDSIAFEVLKESISTAMFIDDKALEPFEENKKGYEDFTKLYKSFKKYNCLLDIRRYKNIGHKSKFNKSLSKIDLLVLDWQLDESDIEYLITLQMLASAIAVKNVHFICIYTRRKNEEIEDQIIYPITSYFSNNHNEKAKEKLDYFYEMLDEQGIELDHFKDRFYGLIKELTFFYHQAIDTSTIFIDIDNLLHKIGIAAELKKLVESTYTEPDFAQKLIHFGYDIYDSPTSNNLYKIHISQKDRNSIYINNTVIRIRNKVDTPDLYGEFCASLIDDHNIFFTLFGLEMRNRFRESSAFIGTEISNIDEIALFYHQNQVPSTDFSELLKNIWKEQASSFLYERKIKILDSLEDYKKGRKIKHKVNTFSKRNESNQINLAKINAFYNTLDIKRMKGDTIKFGDILFRKDDMERKYMLCITPHCDCLHPEENISNMFHFIEGKKIDLSSGLGIAEREFVSFVYYEGHPICIQWYCRPFSIHISTKNNQIHRLIKVNIKGDKTAMSYLCTLRENYSQRIANHSFGFPLRVGITFAKS